MSSAEKIIGGLTMVLLATTLVLPGRQTPQIAEKIFTGASRLSNAVIGQGA